MTESQMYKAASVVFAIALRTYDNTNLAVLSNFVNASGRVEVGTDAYAKALGLSLIRQDGTPQDGLADALVAEVRRRMDTGTFK